MKSRGRERSKSWGTDLHVVAGEKGTINLKSQSHIPPMYLSLHHAHHGHAPLLQIASQQPHLLRNDRKHSNSHLSSHHLNDVQEEGNDTPATVPTSQNITTTKPVEPMIKSEQQGPWPLQDTWKWYNDLPWLAGMNYLPRTAVNFIEMWDETTFNPDIIEEELSWAAEKLGYNTLRTNIPMVLFEADAAGLTKRINKFLRVAARCGFAVCLVPLDDCEFSGKDPVAGKQPDPVPNLHNSQAIGSPGRKITRDESQWWRVEEYIRYIVRTWGQDPRVILLDLYNEPGNPWVFTEEGTFVVADALQYEDCALKLMKKVFEWAREENPRQPLTVSAWHMPDPFCAGSNDVIPLSHPIDKLAMELSDVISVHAYCDLNCLQETLKELTVYGKPILLTEWMARQVKSTYDTALPALKTLRIGAYQWGLVKGKTQTHLPWPHVANQYVGDPMWWHDVLDADGTFHNELEGEIIRSLAYPQNKALSPDIFLMDVSSHESLERLVPVLGTSPSVGSILSEQYMFEDMQQAQENYAVETISNSMFQHQHRSGHHLRGCSSTELPILPEGEQQVIPSVCSISMATINAAAAQQARETTSMLDLDHSLDRAHGASHSKSMPTFGNHMRSPSIEGLDLAEVGGIEF